MRLHRSSLSLLALALAVATGVAVLAATPADATPPDALQAAKAASARYHSVEQALSDGYLPTPVCVAAPGLGGMGYHYANPQLIADPALDPTRPEILVYAEKANGRLELVAIEYLRRSADQTPPIDASDRPVLFGRGFDGPMPEHNPGMGWHYDLHVWLWRDNPSGMFAPFNPAVTCG